MTPAEAETVERILREQRVESARADVERWRAYYQEQLAEALKAAGMKSETGERDRTTLIAALGMLGSEHAGERASAALQVERIRQKLGRQWSNLIL
jgi:hypothetical protein